MEYAVIVEKGSRSFGVSAPDLPGCIAVGRTRAEALRKMRVAIRWHIEALRKAGQPIPKSTTEATMLRVA